VKESSLSENLTAHKQTEEMLVTYGNISQSKREALGRTLNRIYVLVFSGTKVPWVRNKISRRTV